MWQAQACTGAHTLRQSYLLTYIRGAYLHIYTHIYGCLYAYINVHMRIRLKTRFHYISTDVHNRYGGSQNIYGKGLLSGLISRILK